MAKDDWLPSCEHVKNTINEHWERDGIMDAIINLINNQFRRA
jgi:hypothetical protein